MNRILPYFALFVCVFAGAPWPQIGHDAQHTSFVNQTVSSKYSCESSISWVKEVESMDYFTVNYNVSYFLVTGNYFTLVSIDENGKISTIFEDIKEFASNSIISEDGSILYFMDSDVSAYHTSNYSKIWTYKIPYEYFITAKLLLSKSGILYVTYALQGDFNSTLAAISNGNLLWKMEGDLLIDMVLSIDEKTLYFTTASFPSLLNFTFYAVNTSNGLLLWNQTLPDYSGNLMVRGDETVLLNIRPQNESNINGYSYYLINSTSQNITIGLPGSQVAAVQENTIYISRIGAIIPNSPYASLFQFTNISQITENGTIVRSFNFPQPNQGSVDVVVTPDAVFATYSTNDSACVALYTNSSEATVLATRQVQMTETHSLAIAPNGDLIWFIPHTLVARVSTCGGSGTCNQGVCACNKSTFFNHSGSTCEKKSLNGLGVFVIVILPILAVVAIIVIIFGVRARIHHANYQKIH